MSRFKNVLLFALTIFSLIAKAQNSDDKIGSRKEGLASTSLYDVSITVSNLDSAIVWYKNILGFEQLSRSFFKIPTGEAEVAILQGSGFRLELLHFPNAQRIEALLAAPEHPVLIGNKSIVLQVENLAVASAELEKKGVTFLWRERYLTDGAMLCSMIKDFDGNKINIFQKNTILNNNIFKSDKPMQSREQSPIVTEHLRIWNEKNEEKRMELLTKTYAPDADLLDPIKPGKGLTYINDFIKSLYQKFPKYTFTLSDTPNVHGNAVKLNWVFGTPGNPAVSGTDVFVIKKGKIQSLIVFLN